jgi:hypothetical protein
MLYTGDAVLEFVRKPSVKKVGGTIWSNIKNQIQKSFQRLKG